MSLRVHEIFLSLQGEASRVGLPTVFVRLTGCPLRCGYCDTAYAFHGGETMQLAQIMAQVEAYGVKRVTVTGGEPLAQAACQDLLSALCNSDYDVSLETSGALDISKVDPLVSVILDIKTPGSGEVEKNLWRNLSVLKAEDEVKFVLCDRADYDWAKQVMATHNMPCPILLSPVYDRLPPRQLAEWIVADRLPVRFQLQLHKILWGEAPGR